MGELTVNEWRRGAMRRLYVNDADGGRVGWRDAITGEDRLERPELAAEYAAALAAHGAPAPLDRGSAGASAQREYDRRSAKELARKEAAVAEDAAWRAGAKERRPLLGRIVTGLTPKPTITPESQSTKAWAVGAVGERKLGEALDSWPGIRVLHDRRIPRSSANIDHLAITPQGVAIVDAKRYTGLIEVRDTGGWFRSEPHLYVGGRKRDAAVEGMAKQIAAVTAALEPLRTPQGAPIRVVPYLCFVDAEWPLLHRKAWQIGDVVITHRADLQKRLTAPGVAIADLDAVAAHLAAVLRPA